MAVVTWGLSSYSWPHAQPPVVLKTEPVLHKGTERLCKIRLLPASLALPSTLFSLHPEQLSSLQFLASYHFLRVSVHDSLFRLSSHLSSGRDL